MRECHDTCLHCRACLADHKLDLTSDLTHCMSAAGPSRFIRTRAQHRVRVLGRELAKTLALVEKVSGTFSRRDPMRRYMDQIVAMAAASGELRERQWCEGSD